MDINYGILRQIFVTFDKNSISIDNITPIMIKFSKIRHLKSA